MDADLSKMNIINKFMNSYLILRNKKKYLSPKVYKIVPEPKKNQFGSGFRSSMNIGFRLSSGSNH
jgi:hypothetical protein